MPKRGKIFRILRECEASARSHLQSLNNPPKKLFAALKGKKRLPYGWNTKVPHYYNAISLVGEVRRNIEIQNSRSAALAAFRLGQLVIILRDQKAYEAAIQAQKDHARRSAGGKQRSLPSETAQGIRACYELIYQRRPELRNHPYALAEIVARKFECDRKTVLKYANKDRMK